MVVTDVNNVAELQSPGGEHIEFRDDFLLAKAIPDLYNPRVTLDVAMWEIEPGGYWDFPAAGIAHVAPAERKDSVY